MSERVIPPSQQTVLEALTKLGQPTSLIGIMRAAPGKFDSKVQLKSLLEQLTMFGDVVLQGNGQYKLPSSRRKIESNMEFVKKPPMPIKVKPKKVAKESSTNQAPVKESALDAIEKLSKRINSHVDIADITLKCDVLVKLSAAIGEQVIGELLHDIKDDLLKVHRAAA